MRLTELRKKEHASVSCGCHRTERIGGLNRTHGRSKTPEYQAWLALRNRCYRPADLSYKYYGARGITVCEAWRHSFEAFFQEVGARPSPSHSIDRINGDKPYERGNVRWATPTQQSRNRKCMPRITYRGESKTLPEWAEELGMPYNALSIRIHTGWTVERAFTQPVRYAPKRKR